MTDLQAAVGLRQLDVLDTVLRERRRLAERYSALLAGMPSIVTPHDPDYAARTWQSYPIRVGPGAPVGAEELMRRLLRDGIATRRGVMAIHLEEAYAESGAVLPHTEAAARDVVLLPLFPGLSEEAQDYVVSRLAHYAVAEAA
jgi:perosamine synthetase